MQHEKTKELAMTALMTALIFTATYIIKIPIRQPEGTRIWGTV